MRAFALSLLVLLMVGLAGGKLSFQTAPARVVTDAEYERWKKELSNWGRWGKDDEIGALNLITPEKRKQAAGLVREGFSVSLAGDADTVQAVDNPNPYDVKMLAIGNDRIGVAYHGIAHTHLDSLAHINDNGVFYNGYKPDADSVLKGGPYLEPGTPIYVEDLEAWEKQAGVKVSPGDALFVRTGVWARRKEVGPWLRGRAEGGRSAGLDPSVIPWLKQRDIAILGSDHPQYVSPSPLRGAIHDFALLYLGVHLFNNCDLEALGDAAAQRRRWDFLLTAAPLPIRGGTGSPANPIAPF